MKTEKKWQERIAENPVLPKLAPLVILLAAYLQFLSVELSYSSFDIWREIPFLSKCIGVCTVLLLDSVLLLLIGNLRWAMSVSVFLTTVLGVANYFVAKFRGTPFTFVMMQNLTTAMNVISSYSFTLERQLCLLLGCGILSWLIVFLLYPKTRLRMPNRLILLAIGMTGFYFGYLAPNPVVPHNVVGWSWRSSVAQYGYLPCMMQCTVESTSALRKPEGYDEKTVEAFVSDYEIVNQGQQTPDFIFILNETFYDLTRVTELETSSDPLAYLHSLDNSLQGYCYVDGEGGGTNVSEYELLTSNSMYLSPSGNPFNLIDVSGSNSVATYLKQLGYTSLAAHSELGLNYARDAAYPALGFDEIHFEEDFLNPTYYCGRQYKSDDCLYENLIRWYEEMDEGPRALYLLTIQNHANYDALEPEEYLVTVEGDYGDLTGSINEFLTCISLSDRAFEKLVDYFSQVERDVVICMVGDHGPIFVNQLVSQEAQGHDRVEKICAVPYVVWSNHLDLSEKGMQEETCLPYLVPKVLQLGNVTLPTYYDYIVQMQERIPFFTGFGHYADPQGNVYSFRDETPYTALLERYFDLAYADMTKARFMRN